ncbi:MAG: hypothetical protein ACLR5J_06645 [Lachnospiraceae bacterium]
MEQKLYKTVNSAGISSIVTGIIAVVAGLACVAGGILALIQGGRLLGARRISCSDKPKGFLWKHRKLSAAMPHDTVCAEFPGRELLQVYF